MTMASDSGGAPPMGAAVYTADGDRLGTVKEVVGGCFKVDARMQPDYWLASDCITSTTGTEVRLNVAKDELGDAKMDGPDHTGVHRHDAGETVL